MTDPEPGAPPPEEEPLSAPRSEWQMLIAQLLGTLPPPQVPVRGRRRFADDEPDEDRE